MMKLKNLSLITLLILNVFLGWKYYVFQNNNLDLNLRLENKFEHALIDLIYGYQTNLVAKAEIGNVKVNNSKYIIILILDLLSDVEGFKSSEESAAQLLQLFRTRKFDYTKDTFSLNLLNIYPESTALFNSVQNRERAVYWLNFNKFRYEYEEAHKKSKVYRSQFVNNDLEIMVKDIRGSMIYKGSLKALDNPEIRDVFISNLKSANQDKDSLVEKFWFIEILE